MSAFAKTRAAAEYAARPARTELARTRAAVLLTRLSACEAAMTGGDGQPPVVAAGLLRSLVLAVRDLARPAWLDASGDDPDVAAFTAMQATASPPDPARIDEICSRVLWARFPPGTAGCDARDLTGRGGGPGSPAPRHRRHPPPRHQET
jgi:hypothetical protein